MSTAEQTGLVWLCYICLALPGDLESSRNCFFLFLGRFHPPCSLIVDLFHMQNFQVWFSFRARLQVASRQCQAILARHRIDLKHIQTAARYRHYTTLCLSQNKKKTIYNWMSSRLVFPLALVLIAWLDLETSTSSQWLWIQGAVIECTLVSTDSIGMDTCGLLWVNVLFRHSPGWRGHGEQLFL